MTQIYVRERRKVGSGVKQPKYRIVAVTGENNARRLWVQANHFRKTELEAIAADIGAKIVYLEPVAEEEHGSKKE
jgi:hypothetical protein